MSPEQLERVFGRGRLQMKTGRHVEVFREAAAPGERRRYTKRFLATQDGDFRAWTEREWRLLARMIGHGVRCVPEVVRFDRGDAGGAALVQTFDAGATVDHWATLLPLQRDGRSRRHLFEDAAHWWALAHHGLVALEQIHRLQLVHLDVKADNVCIPYAPADFEPGQPGRRLRAVFGELALIDFAFSVVTGEDLAMPLPIGRQPDYAYQSPRLLAALEAGRAGELGPTRALDWRCDIYSLAAMLARYLPPAGAADASTGWTPQRFAHAQTLLGRLREVHDHADPRERPHAELIEACAQPLRDAELVASLERGWQLALDARATAAEAASTPVTRLAPALTPLAAEPAPQPSPAREPGGSPPGGTRRVVQAGRPRLRRLVVPALALAGLALLVPPALDAARSISEATRAMREAVRSVLGPGTGSDAPRAPAPAAAPAETFEQRARRLIERRLPEIAARLEDEVGAVLRTAGRAETGFEDAGVLDLARRIRLPDDAGLGRGNSPGDARRLNEAAREAFWTRRSVREAHALQLRAFGADPRDAEIVGNLAFLQLKLAPSQPETARRLALYALSLGGRQFPAGRVEDWGSLAVASALSGRERDARDALFVMLAASRDLERSCRSALSAVANYGTAMRPPVEAMLRRIHERGGSAAPSCRWPPDWSAGVRVP
ncbi:hypothetical protein [Caldimonas tepidiphila]|uniref:hypothetical protein n=1 Tax=Caldimonas tepidiphila TaxID=2315841 RepID=UPI000E5BA139|nr:hypothetical protein [Caldimonas tepidiphila]